MQKNITFLTYYSAFIHDFQVSWAYISFKKTETNIFKGDNQIMPCAKKEAFMAQRNAASIKASTMKKMIILLFDLNDKILAGAPEYLRIGDAQHILSFRVGRERVAA